MLNTQNKNGFSLAEMMVVMLMLSIIFAAAAPILTKRATQTSEVKSSGGSGVPIGTVIIWSFETLPQGDEAGKWLECNGQSTDGYPELKDIAGKNVPDYRGVFLRGQGSRTYSQNNGSTVGTTSTTYSSSTLGVIQGDAIRNITGNSGAAVISGPSGAFTGSYYGNHMGASSWAVYHCSMDISRVVPTANEIRPLNIAVKYIIKAKN